MDMDMVRDMQEQPRNSDQHQSHESHEMPRDVGIINHMSDYQGLRSLFSTVLPENQSWREIPLRLTGNMRRYVWSFNDKTLAQDAQILIKKGENVRFILQNETMMNHPLHLHGHFFRVVNRQ